MYLYLYLKNLFNSEEGQDLVEYALILVLIVLVVALAMPTLTNAIAGVYTRIATRLAAP